MQQQFSIDEQIAEVKRELGMRRHVYPRFVESKRLTQREADHRVSILEAVAETLQHMRDLQQPSLDL